MPGFTLTPVACGLRPGATCPNGRFRLYIHSLNPCLQSSLDQKKPGGTLLRQPGTLTATGDWPLRSSLERMLRDDTFATATG
jgi:hypothetical protein